MCCLLISSLTSSEWHVYAACSRRRQPYPDNHTDDSFLERLVLNGRITPRRLSRVILDATTVSQQLAVVALKAAAVAHLLDDGSGAGYSRPHSLMLLDGVLLLCGVIANVVLHGPAHAARQSARVGPALLLGLFALTPLFHTMTAAISDDTAVATATCSLLLHLLTHDYALLDSYTARLGGSASLGAAMFAAALLASRLPTTSAVFADMLLALVLFVLFPFLRRDVRRASTAAHLALTAAVHAATLAAVLALPGSGRLIAAGYVAAVAGIVLACPVWLIRMMAFKVRKLFGAASGLFGQTPGARMSIHLRRGRAPARPAHSSTQPDTSLGSHALVHTSHHMSSSASSTKYRFFVSCFHPSPYKYINIPCAHVAL